jgi:signal transduction histidine kinase
VKAEISRLNRLVVDFLSFGTPVRLDPRPCALGDVARDVAALVEHKARDQGIALTVDAPDGLPLVTADPELLKTCFLNLMINSVDAMPAGGRLAVAIRREAVPEDALVLTVADTGQGMSAADVATAFEPYVSSKETGFGLGLALTRKIVGDHGGTVTLDSAQGVGTTATIRLPLARAAAGAGLGRAAS